MKLKRLLSALVVFTIVMTSVVCSVSAAATYTVTTGYNLNTGKVTLNASVTGATDGDMVSYIIYGDDVVDETETITEGNIIHIDQATVSGNTANFDAVSFDSDAIKNRNIQFASTANETSTDRVTVTKNEYMVTVDARQALNSLKNFDGAAIDIIVLDKNGDPTTHTLTYTPNNVDPETYEPTNNVGRLAYLPADATGIIIDFQKYSSATRGAVSSIALRNATEWTVASNGQGSFNQKTLKNSTTIFQSDALTKDGDSASDYELGNVSVNNLINGRYKATISNGKINGTDVDWTAGAYIDIYGMTAPTAQLNQVSASSTKYMTIDSAPVVVKNGNETTITFLATNLTDETEFGLNVYAYPKAALDNTTASNTAGVTGTLVGSYKAFNGASADGKFAIQLHDTLGELNTDTYYYEAVPFIGEDPVELNVFDLNYYTIDRNTTAIEE